MPPKSRAEIVDGVLTTVVGVADLGRILGLTERRIQHLTQGGVLVPIAKGKFSLGPALHAYLAFLRKGESAEGEGGKSAAAEMAGHRVRLTAAQADREELELAKARSEVAPVADFERALSRTMAEIRANVLNVPQRVVLSLLGETDEARFKSVLRGELSDALAQSADADLLEGEGSADLSSVADDE